MPSGHILFAVHNGTYVLKFTGEIRASILYLRYWRCSPRDVESIERWTSRRSAPAYKPNVRVGADAGRQVRRGRVTRGEGARGAPQGARQRGRRDDDVGEQSRRAVPADGA